jgi:hypothetical protein
MQNNVITTKTSDVASEFMNKMMQNKLSFSFEYNIESKKYDFEVPDPGKRAGIVC